MVGLPTLAMHEVTWIQSSELPFRATFGITVVVVNYDSQILFN